MNIIKNKKFKKVFSIFVMLLIVFAAFKIYKNNQHTKLIKRAEADLLVELDNTDKTMEKINEQYSDKANGYLKEGLTNERLAKVEKEVNAYKESYLDYSLKKNEIDVSNLKEEKGKLVKAVEVVRLKLDVQDEVNDLFQKTVIDGTNISEKESIKYALTDKDIEKVEKSLSNYLEHEKEDNWHKSLVSLTQNAKDQLTANKLVSNLFNGDTVKENVSNEQLTEAKTTVDGLKQSSTKSSLEEKVARIEKRLTESNSAKAAASEVATNTSKDANSPSVNNSHTNAQQGGGTTNNTQVNNTNPSNNTASGSGESGGSSNVNTSPTQVTSVGNSGRTFGSSSEADSWADGQATTINGTWFNKGYEVYPVMMSDGSISGYSVNFF